MRKEGEPIPAEEQVPDLSDASANEEEEQGVKIEIKEKKKPEKIPISREEFVMNLYEAFEFWKNRGKIVENELENVRGMFDKLAIAEQLGMKVEYFAIPEENRVEFIAREKGKFGFRGVVKNNEKPCPENSGQGKSVSEKAR